jgi:hypothetical protein
MRVTYRVTYSETSGAPPVQIPGRSSCYLQKGDQVRARENTRAWDQPDVVNGQIAGTVPAGRWVYVLDGPRSGRIRRDKDVSGQWWQVGQDWHGPEIGWIWEGCIEECGYTLD